MNCIRVRALIAALPLRELRPKDREEVEFHASSCAVCADALAREDAIAGVLASAPRPRPSRDLSAAILARIGDTTTIAEPHPAVVVPRVARRGTVGWSAVAVGLVTAAGASAYRIVSGGVLPTLDPAGWPSSVVRGVRGVVALPTPDAALGVLVLGLLLAALGIAVALEGGEGTFSRPGPS